MSPTPFGPSDLAEFRLTNPRVRLVDVRTPGEFASGHIDGSTNVPLPDLAAHRDELIAPDAGPVVLVCQSGHRAETARRRLRTSDLHDVWVLGGGVDAWAAQGRPLARSAAATGWTIERQVRGVAGGVVLASIVASAQRPATRYVAGAIGAGLTFSALSDTCAMGTVLARMPWNRSRGSACGLELAVAPSHPATPDQEVSR